MIVADGPEDPGGEGSVQLDRELLGRDVLEDVREVAGIEGDRGPIALDGGFDEVYQLAADMGGMGFIHSAECEIMRNNVLINGKPMARSGDATAPCTK